MKLGARYIGLIPSSICKRCSNHYPFSSREYSKYTPNACEKLKGKLKKQALKT